MKKLIGFVSALLCALILVSCPQPTGESGSGGGNIPDSNAVVVANGEFTEGAQWSQEGWSIEPADTWWEQWESASITWPDGEDGTGTRYFKVNRKTAEYDTPVSISQEITFPTSGSYTAELTVTDSWSTNASDTVTLEVIGDGGASLGSASYDIFTFPASKEWQKVLVNDITIPSDNYNATLKITFDVNTAEQGCHIDNVYVYK